MQFPACRGVQKCNFSGSFYDGRAEKAIFWVNGGMADFLDYGLCIRYFVWITWSLTGQVACATDMSLFGYDQGVFSMLGLYRIDLT
jgi:hypothetical protein